MPAGLPVGRRGRSLDSRGGGYTGGRRCHGVPDRRPQARGERNCQQDRHRGDDGDELELGIPDDVVVVEHVDEKHHVQHKSPEKKNNLKNVQYDAKR